MIKKTLLSLILIFSTLYITGCNIDKQSKQTNLYFSLDTVRNVHISLDGNKNFITKPIKPDNLLSITTKFDTIEKFIFKNNYFKYTEKGTEKKGILMILVLKNETQYSFYISSKDTYIVDILNQLKFKIITEN